MILLDADSLTLLLHGNANLEGRIERLSIDEKPGVAIISRIEILTGRFQSVMKAADAIELLRNLERLQRSEAQLKGFAFVGVDALAAAKFDELRTIKGLKKIGRGDLLLASIALAHNALLVSRNLRDFRQVPGLRVENWAD